MPVPVIESKEKNFGSSSATLTCNKPAGVVSGDLLILICNNDNDSNDVQFTDNKTGWVFLGTFGNVTRDVHVGIFSRVSDGTEGSSESVTATDVENWSMFYIRISGVDATTPINQLPAFSQSTGTSIPIGGVTTDEDDCLIIYGLAFDGGDGFPFSVSGTGFSQDDEVQSGTGALDTSACWGHRELASQGSSGTATVTTSISDGTVSFQMAINATTGAITRPLPQRVLSGPFAGPLNGVF